MKFSVGEMKGFYFQAIRIGIVSIALFGLSGTGYSQKNTSNRDTVMLKDATLDQLIKYALDNRPEIKQAKIDERIGEKDIQSAMSGWMPQIGLSAAYTYNIKLQENPLTVNGQTNFITMGQRNNSSLVLQADQQILNAGLIQASKSIKYYRKQYDENTEAKSITTVVQVSKAYYDILMSQEQLNIITQNIARIEKQYNDAKALYESGMADKTDFQRAQISLSNSKADLKRTQELLNYKYAYLKVLLGYEPTKELTISYDISALEKDVYLSDSDNLNVENRVEYRQLETQKKLQKINVLYNKLQFMPTLSGVVNYNLVFNRNDFASLYNQSYPSSAAGLRLSLPIFTGVKRIHQIRKAEMIEEKIDLDLENIKNQINSQYILAIASYRANLNDFEIAKENMELSLEVYNTIKDQYDAGVKSYLELMTSETDLKMAQLNYLNTLYNVHAAKLDVKQALGKISISK